MFDKKQLILLGSKIILKALLALIASATIVFIVSQRISKISDSLAKDKTLYATSIRKNEIAINLRESFKIINGYDKKIELALPADDNILEFVGLLENLSGQNSVQYSYKFNSPISWPEQENISTIDYSLNLKGNIYTFINFLKNFEKMPYFTGAYSINISSISKAGWEEDSSISLQAKLFTKQN